MMAGEGRLQTRRMEKERWERGGPMDAGHGSEGCWSFCRGGYGGYCCGGNCCRDGGDKGGC